MTIKEDLIGGNYAAQSAFIKDMRLIFTNSKNYNTNKRSRVSVQQKQFNLPYHHQLCQVKFFFRTNQSILEFFLEYGTNIYWKTFKKIRKIFNLAHVFTTIVALFQCACVKFTLLIVVQNDDSLQFQANKEFSFFLWASLPFGCMCVCVRVCPHHQYQSFIHLHINT